MGQLCPTDPGLLLLNPELIFSGSFSRIAPSANSQRQSASRGLPRPPHTNSRSLKLNGQVPFSFVCSAGSTTALFSSPDGLRISTVSSTDGADQNAFPPPSS